MKRLFTSATPADGASIEILDDLLAQNKIRCMIRTVSNSMGEVPFLETWPELWIEKDEDYPKAYEILKTVQNAEVESNIPWSCSDCGEIIEGQFTSCWQCGSERSTRPSAGL